MVQRLEPLKIPERLLDLSLWQRISHALLLRSDLRYLIPCTLVAALLWARRPNWQMASFTALAAMAQLALFYALYFSMSDRVDYWIRFTFDRITLSTAGVLLAFIYACTVGKFSKNSLV